MDGTHQNRVLKSGENSYQGPESKYKKWRFERFIALRSLCHTRSILCNTFKITHQFPCTPSNSTQHGPLSRLPLSCRTCVPPRASSSSSHSHPPTRPPVNRLVLSAQALNRSPWPVAIATCPMQESLSHILSSPGGLDGLSLLAGIVKKQPK